MPAADTGIRLSLRIDAVFRDLRRLSDATHRVTADLGRVPRAEEWPQILLQPPSDAAGWRGPYARRVLDPWNSPYLYVVDARLAAGVGIYSMGRNRVDDGGHADDVSSWAGCNAWIYFPARRWFTGALCLMVPASFWWMRRRWQSRSS